MNKSEIALEDYNSYYQPYIDKAGTGNVFDDLRSNHETIILFLKSIPVEKLHYRYAKGKWAIKEILLHLIDTERVFTYRAMCIARNDKTELPGFDQDDFVAHSNADKRSMESLLSEYQSVRKATISLFESFNKKGLARIGTVSHSRLSVRAIALIILGHESHHLQMIKEHYL